MLYLIALFSLITLILVFFKFILCEMDGRRANKQYNLRYFLNFNKPFKYGKTMSMIFMAFLCFIIFADIDIFSLKGIIYFCLFLVLSILMDIISQFAYYQYGKKRFKVGIVKAIEEKEKLEEACEHDDYESIKYPENAFSFVDVCEKYFEEDYHIAITSMDGGYFASRFQNLPYVTFLIDHFEGKAHKLLDYNSNIRITKLTENNGLPFKDNKLDMYIVNYSNFDKKDVHRVLKDNGLLLLRHKGNNDMREININVFNNMRASSQWNSYMCSDILKQNDFSIIDSQEVNNLVKFNTIESLLTYLKKNTADQKINIEALLNQLAFIDATIKQKGSFSLTMHEFYIVARKI